MANIYMEPWTISSKIDLNEAPNSIGIPQALMFPGDNGAHRWQVNVFLDGEPVNKLSEGNVVGYFLRPDGQTVVVTGAAYENTAFVLLPEEVYAVSGIVKAALVWEAGYGRKVTMAAALFNILPAYDSGSHVIPS